MRIIERIMQHWLFMEPNSMEEEPAWKPEGSQEVTLPHCWNAEDPSITGIRAYQTIITIEKQKNKCYFLDFGAVSGIARVYVNGHYMGEHKGSYARFRFEISDVIHTGENKVSVLTDNTRYSDMNPMIGDFNLYGGISREVNLIITENAHFDLLYYGSDGLDIETDYDGKVRIRARVINADDQTQLRYYITSPNTMSIQYLASISEEVSEIQVKQPHLWNGKKDPYLYECIAELLVDGEVIDCVRKKIGFRKIEIFPDKGLFLNDAPCKVRGVAKHNDVAEKGNALCETDMLLDMNLIDEMGANSIRLSHYQHPDYFLDLCDERGMLAWAEIPMLSMPSDNEAIMENAKIMVKELILQQKHHPSIFCWGVQNEITMTGEYPEMKQNVEALHAVVRENDTTRFSASANIGFLANTSALNCITDVQGYNLYSGWYYGDMHDYSAWFKQFHKDCPNICLAMTEYGVESNVSYHSSHPHVKDYTEEYQALYHEVVYPQVEAAPFVWGSYVWNMFDFGSALRDEGGTKGKNCKGLITFDRRIKKDAFYIYKAMWSEDPFLHIAGKRYAKRAEEKTTICVSSNLSNITLSVNGEVYTAQNQGPVYHFEEVTLQKGDNIIKVYSGEIQDECVITYVDEPENSYIFVDPYPEFNVANWYKDEDGQGDFKEIMYSLEDTMTDLLANDEVRKLLEERLPDIMQDKRSKNGGSMALLSILNFNRDKYSEDEVRELNACLNRIHK